MVRVRATAALPLSKQGGRTGRREYKPGAVVVVPGHVAGVRRSIAGERALLRDRRRSGDREESRELVRELIDLRGGERVGAASELLDRATAWPDGRREASQDA